MQGLFSSLLKQMGCNPLSPNGKRNHLQNKRIGMTRQSCKLDLRS